MLLNSQRVYADKRNHVFVHKVVCTHVRLKLPHNVVKAKIEVYWESSKILVVPTRTPFLGNIPSGW